MDIVEIQDLSYLILPLGEVKDDFLCEECKKYVEAYCLDFEGGSYIICSHCHTLEAA